MARPVLCPIDMITAIASRSPTIPLERMELPELLASVEPFTAATPDEISLLARATVRVRKTAGAAILEEGLPPDGLYVVLRGRVNLVRGAAGPRDLILMSHGPGDVLGETCALDRGPCSAAALAAVPVDLLRIPAEVIAAHVRRQPETLLRLTQLVTDKLRELEAVASSLALQDVESRLRRTLLRLAQRQGRGSAAQGWILAPVPTQTELARMVGSCRETVSRTLSAMARDGLLSSTGRRMLLDPRLVAAAA